MISSHIVINVHHADSAAIPAEILQCMFLTSKIIKGIIDQHLLKLPYFLQYFCGEEPPISYFSIEDLSQIKEK